MTKKRRKQLEKALKLSNIFFWVNVVCVFLNVGIYFITKHWFTLLVGMGCIVLAALQNSRTKFILWELGRGEEI